jgi:methionine-rich copper-binding protein CopC
MRWKMTNDLRKALIIALVLLCSIMLALPILAGQGDGSGGGKNQPLALVSSIPADGQKDVALPGEIKMTFSKNVVYMTVRDNNSKCFTMYSQDGKQVPIEVIMADDQIEFDKRRDIVVKPLQELQTGITYTVKVAPQLESKSGVNLGKEATLSFTTAGAAAPTADKATSTSKDADVNAIEVSNSNLSGQKAPDSELTTSGGQGQLTEQAAESNVLDSSQIPEQVTEVKTGDLSPESNRVKTPDGEKGNSNKGINTGVIVAAIIGATALVYAIYRKRGK